MSQVLHSPTFVYLQLANLTAIFLPLQWRGICRFLRRFRSWWVRPWRTPSPRPPPHPPWDDSDSHMTSAKSVNTKSRYGVTTEERMCGRRKYCQGLKTWNCRNGLSEPAQPVKILALDTFCRSLNKQNKVRLFFLDQRPHQVQEFDSPGCLLWACWAVPYFAALASFRNSPHTKTVLSDNRWSCFGFTLDAKS